MPPAGVLLEHPHGEALTLDLPEHAKVRSAADAAARRRSPALVTITLNGEPYQVDGPVSVSTLLASLAIDSRRVAVEHNQVVVRRALFESTIVGEGDAVEIVNFVGGGAPAGSAASPLKIPYHGHP